MSEITPDVTRENLCPVRDHCPKVSTPDGCRCKYWRVVGSYCAVLPCAVPLRAAFDACVAKDTKIAALKQGNAAVDKALADLEKVALLPLEGVFFFGNGVVEIHDADGVALYTRREAQRALAALANAVKERADA